MNRPTDAVGERSLLSDIKVLRERARDHVERGAVTTDYGVVPSARGGDGPGGKGNGP